VIWWILLGLFIWSVIGVAVFYTAMLASLFNNTSWIQMSVTALISGPGAWVMVAWLALLHWQDRRKIRRHRQ
jgi:hypothetical protein